jgi:hypothetical protein
MTFKSSHETGIAVRAEQAPNVTTVFMVDVKRLILGRLLTADSAPAALPNKDDVILFESDPIDLHHPISSALELLAVSRGVLSLATDQELTATTDTQPIRTLQ